MTNLSDYLAFRGDLTLRTSPLNEVDAVLLTQVTFMDLSDIAGGSGRNAPTLREAIERYFATHNVKSFGKLMPADLPDLICRIGDSRRFGDLRVSHYKAYTDIQSETQFAALTLSLGFGASYITFCGTDDSIIGWKENFNMCFLDTVPAQHMALDYFCDVAAHTHGKLYVAGHSKGGNLALYAATFAPPRVQKRIARVWSADGPGFPRSVTDTEGYRRIADRVYTILPHFSVVGLLLEHGEADKIVKSDGAGIFQHEPRTWNVRGCAFVPDESGLSRESKQLAQTIKAMLAELTPDERREFIDALYRVTVGINAKTLTDLAEHKLDLVKAVGKVDGKTRGLLLLVIKLFVTEHFKTTRSGKRAPETAAK